MRLQLIYEESIFVRSHTEKAALPSGCNRVEGQSSSSTLDNVSGSMYDCVFDFYIIHFFIDVQVIRQTCLEHTLLQSLPNCQSEIKNVKIYFLGPGKLKRFSYTLYATSLLPVFLR